MTWLNWLDVVVAVAHGVAWLLYLRKPSNNLRSFVSASAGWLISTPFR